MKKLTDKEIQELLEKQLHDPETEYARQNTSAESATDYSVISNTGQISDDLFQQENNKDLETYALLFDTLRKEPQIMIPMDFSRKLSRKIIKEREKVNDYKFYILISIIATFGLAASFFCLSLIDQKTATIFFDTLINYKWIWIFALVVLLLVQLSDQRLSKLTALKKA